jgi:uncharacterized protein YegP (UPF0339 family)
MISIDSHYKISGATGCYCFKLVTSNNRVAGTSELYRTLPGLEFGISEVKKVVAMSVIEDFCINVRYFR